MLAKLSKTIDLTKELTALVEATGTLPRGSFVSHETIAEVSGIEYQGANWNRLIQKWKQAMEGRGLWVKAAVPYGTGYKILPLSEQIETEPANLERQARRKLNRAARCLGIVPPDELTDDQRRFQAARLGQMAERKKIQQEHQAQAAAWLSNPQTLPKVAPPAIKQA